MRAPDAAIASDDEIAQRIVEVLCRDLRRSPKFLTEIAINQIKRQIEELRAYEEPRPSEAAEANRRIGKLAEEFASCIEQLSPGRRAALRWSVFDGALFDRANTQPSRMGTWIADLEKIPGALERLQNRCDLFPLGRKDRCAMAARHLISSLSPETELTKGDNSKFYLITSLLWSAATGQRDKDMKHICDKNIDSIKAMKKLLK
jgi:hypothetical protein